MKAGERLPALRASVDGIAFSDTERPAMWLLNFDRGGQRTHSGEDVSPTSAMGLSTYWACLNNISQDMAKLPLQLRRRREARGSDLADGHPLVRLLRKPNPLMVSYVWRQVMQHRLLGWGNAYAEIVRNGRDEVVELWPVHPMHIRPVLQADGRTLVYEYRPFGKAKLDELEPRHVLHLRGMGSGVEGYSVLRFASECIGLGLAAQNEAARFFGKGMSKRLVAVAKGVMNPQARKEFRARVQTDKENDPEGARKLPFLEGDIDLKDVGIPPDEAQFLETRTFGVPDVARWFRMALAKVQHEGSAKGWNSVESFNRDYATDALHPWARLWEETLEDTLFTDVEKSAEQLFFKHVFQALLRGDFDARTNGYQRAIASGWMTPNEARDLEDMNPDDDPAADRLYMQGAMTPIEKAGESRAVPGAPPAAVAPGAPGDKDMPLGSGEGEEMDQEPEPAQVALADVALVPVAKDAALRMVRKEAHAVRRALQQHAGDAGALEAWAGPFYARFEAEVVEAFTPCTCALAALTGSRNQDERLRGVVAAWLACEDRVAYCRAVAASGAEECRADELAALVLDQVVPLEKEAHHA